MGLNLQRAASACVNLELPWNPAVLEQRIGRIHRLGQERPIDVYNLMTRGSIEERIAGLVADKRALFKGLFEGATDELRFDGGSAIATVLEHLTQDALPPGGSAASENSPDDSRDDEEDDESSAGEARADSAVDIAPRAETGGARGEASAPAPTPSGEVDRLFGAISVRRLDDGGVVIEAPPEAARALVSVFEGMARLLAAAAPPGG